MSKNFKMQQKTIVEEQTATDVDFYFESQLLQQDLIPAKVLEQSLKTDLPLIHVPPTHGKFLKLLIQMQGAKRVLEIGTLGAYSTVWMAQGVGDDGHVISLDFDERWIAIAQQHIDLAQLQERITIIPGVALESLEQMIAENFEPFDFIFIDADKGNNPNYLEACLALSRPGTVIIADNVVRRGRILEQQPKANNIIGLQKFFDLIKANPRLDATAIQTVGAKAWDGFAMVLVKE